MKTTTSFGNFLLLLIFITTTYALPGDHDHSKDGWNSPPSNSGWDDDNNNSGWSGWTSEVTLCSQIQAVDDTPVTKDASGGRSTRSTNQPCNGICGAINTSFKNGCCFGSTSCYCCSKACDSVTNRDCDCSNIKGLTQTSVGGQCGLKGNQTSVHA